jgi:hypothetical protein
LALRMSDAIAVEALEPGSMPNLSLPIRLPSSLELQGYDSLAKARDRPL